MKRVEAIVKPFKLEEVKDALGQLGMEGMTVTEVKGFTRKTDGEIYRGVEYKQDYLPMISIEIIMPDECLSVALEMIARAARTGKKGDGVIFVSDVVEAIRIRTEERGEFAI
jgi:nitrogen regulatory protein P-II 1